MRVSEALDLGSIPNVATKNPISASEMGFLLFKECAVHPYILAHYLYTCGSEAQPKIADLFLALLSGFV
jgi:hypothetical protein